MTIIELKEGEMYCHFCKRIMPVASSVKHMELHHQRGQAAIAVADDTLLPEVVQEKK